MERYIPVINFLDQVQSVDKDKMVEIFIKEPDEPPKEKMKRLIQIISRSSAKNIKVSNKSNTVELTTGDKQSLSLDAGNKFVVSKKGGDKSVSKQGGGGDINVPKEITELLQLLDKGKKKELKELVIEEEGRAKEGVDKKNTIKELIDAHKKIMESFPDNWEENRNELRTKLMGVVRNTGHFSPVGSFSPEKHPELWEEAYKELKSKKGKSKPEGNEQVGGSKPKKRKKNTKKRKKSKKRKSTKRSKNILQSLPERITSFLTSTSYAKSTKKKKSKRTKRKTKQR